jgi:hypothetical protein
MSTFSNCMGVCVCDYVGPCGRISLDRGDARGGYKQSLYDT